MSIKIGDKNNGMTVIRFSDRKRHIIIKCHCGNESIVRIDGFYRNKSCGCLIGSATKHNMSKTKIYQSWHQMKSRCLNKNHHAYRDYGGRGITICKEWKDSFETFYKDMRNRPYGKSLDRIDNKKGYSKENCKWSTSKEQMNNNRSNHKITYKGKTQNISQWAEELKINPRTMRARIRTGMSVDKILSIKLLTAQGGNEKV